MQLIDLDQTIFVPIVDETKGGVTYEIQMTVAEFFDKFCNGFAPEVVEAIPVKWLEGLMNILAAGDANGQGQALLLSHIIKGWREEREAQDG